MRRRVILRARFTLRNFPKTMTRDMIGPIHITARMMPAMGKADRTMLRIAYLCFEHLNALLKICDATRIAAL